MRLALNWGGVIARYDRFSPVVLRLRVDLGVTVDLFKLRRGEAQSRWNRQSASDRRPRLMFDPSERSNDLPEVEEMRNLALTRLARPSMLRVPMNEVLIVLTALYW